MTCQVFSADLQAACNTKESCIYLIPSWYEHFPQDWV